MSVSDCENDLPRAVRALRRKQGLSQDALARRARVSREMVSRLEGRAVDGMTLSSVDRVVEALGAALRVDVAWRGEELDRLLDAPHARMVQSVATLRGAAGWIVVTELSFHDYGDRGRADILAWHPGRRVVLVIEVKSAIGDLQDTICRLDIKARLAPMLARARGLTDLAAVTVALVVGDSRRARAVVRDHPTYFARFTVRGRQAVAWLRHPTTSASGLLWFTNGSDSREVARSRYGGSARRPDSREM